MSNDLLFLPNFILLAGQQQNVGKTTLACSIISRFSRQHSIVALKLSPHMHTNTGSAQLIVEGKGFQLFRETETTTNKDTSRMLMAGANEAFFLQTDKDSILEGIKSFHSRIEPGALVVCESAGLREYIKPGVFLMLRQLSCRICSLDDEKMFALADRIVTFTTSGFDMDMDELKLKDGKWSMAKSNPE